MLTKFRKLIMISVDLVLINAALFFAFMIRFNWQLSSTVASGYISLILWATVFRLVLLDKLTPLPFEVKERYVV